MKKRFIYGHLTIIAAAIFAVLGTFLLEYLETKTTNPIRIDIIFSICGGVMGIASIMIAIGFYTGEFENKK